MSGGHLEHCGECSVALGSRLDWAAHLLEGGHQLRARQGLENWERGRALVMYTSFELITPQAVEGVLEWFSSQSWSGSAGVTEVVLSPSRSHLALVRFETA